MTMPDKNTEVEKLVEEFMEKVSRVGDYQSSQEYEEITRSTLNTAYSLGQQNCTEWHVKSPNGMVNPMQEGFVAGLKRAVSLLPEDDGKPITGLEPDDSMWHSGFATCRKDATQAITNEIKEREG